MVLAKQFLGSCCVGKKCLDPNPKSVILIHLIPDPESSIIDDSIDVAKSLCNASPLAALLILEPVVHSSVSQLAIVKKRRYLDDKVLSLLVSTLESDIN